MPRRPPDDPDYGGYHIRALKAAARNTETWPHEIPGDLVDAVNGAIRFLDRRLTDAAKAGCHHCDEGERGTPCRWCGLKTKRR